MTALRARKRVSGVTCQFGKHSVIEPARIDELGLARNPLEAKTETANDGQAPVVGGCCGAPDPVDTGSNKGEIEAGSRRFGHITVATSVAMQPIPKLTGPV
jgi:hypothetical protein